jgi:hypothetical protein
MDVVLCITVSFVVRRMGMSAKLKLYRIRHLPLFFFGWLSVDLLGSNTALEMRCEHLNKRNLRQQAEEPLT